MKTLLSVMMLVCMGTVNAALVDFNFRYDQVVLKNGRKLEKVTFTTYDTATGKVGAIVGARLATTIRLDDLPDDIVVRIKERAPALAEDEMKAEKAQIEESKAEAKRRARELEQRTLDEAKANRDAQRMLDVKKAETTLARESQTEITVSKAARELATHYFTYEADKHSSVGYVFNSSVILEDPEPVPGWTNRWRVRGKVGVQYLTTNVGAVGRNTKEFEMLIDAPAKGKPKLVDITISRM